MTKLQINLSSRPFANYTLYHLGYVVIGLAGLLLLAHNAYWFFSNHGDVRQMEQEIAALQTEVDSNIHETSMLGDKIDQVQKNRRFREICTFVDGRIRQRRFSWIRMLNLLQQAIPPDVKIESITPRVQQESIRITLACMARKDEAVNLFIENLENIEEFDRVLITSEDKEGSTVSFPLTMEYSPFGFPDAAGRITVAEAPPESADGEPDAVKTPEPGSLAEAISVAEFPDPEFSDPDYPGGNTSPDGEVLDPFAIGDDDPFAIGDDDPFAIGDDDPFASSDLLFEEMGESGGETDTIPAPVTEGDPAPETGSRKTKSSGDMIKLPPRKPGDRKNRLRPPGRKPGGRP